MACHARMTHTRAVHGLGRALPLLSPGLMTGHFASRSRSAFVCHFRLKIALQVSILQKKKYLDVTQKWVVNT